MDIFGTDSEKWYEKNLYYNRFILYSYLYKDEVIATISVNKMDLLVDGFKKTALQLSGVMTHPDHRNKGLSTSLINHIIEKYENDYDMIFIFAKDINQINRKENMMRKLNTDDENDCNIILRIIKNRQPVSQKLGVFNDLWPLHIFCMYIKTISTT